MTTATFWNGRRADGHLDGEVPPIIRSVG